MQIIQDKKSRERVFRIPLTLHPAQRVIDRSLARYKIVRAGRKFGKTTLAQKKALDWVGPPNSPVWLIGPTYKQTKLIIWNDLKRLIPSESLAKKPNETDLIFQFKNGSSIFLMGGDEPDSLRGPDPAGVILEEAAMHRPEIWANVLRPNLMPRKAPALFITTPRGFNWFKDLEDKARKLRAAGDESWEIFHYTVYDNPHITRSEIDQARADCDSDVVWRQEYMAEYESSVGRVFNSFSDERHVRKIPLPSGLFNVWRAIDWGMRDNTACLWGFVREGCLYVYREHLENNLPATAQAQIIKNRTPANEKVTFNIIGHDADKQDPEMKGLTVRWHFQNTGISPLRVSGKNKQASRQMIQRLLAENRIVLDPFGCPNLHKQLLAYQWKDTALEKPEDGHDDAVDALHYLVEMLQFELFIDHSRPKEQTWAELCAEIAREKLEQSKSRAPMIFPRDTDDPFQDSFDGTAGGYL